MNTELKLILIVAIIATAGCASVDDDSNSPDPSTSGESATVRGALTSEASAESASQAELFVVDENGNAESASTTDVSAEGTYSFSFDVDSSLEGERTLIVKAYNESNAEIGSVVAERVVMANETIVMAPMDKESEMEARIVLDVRASGECEACSVESTRAFISAQVAAQAQSSEEDYEDLRAGLIARTEAQSTVIVEGSNAQTRGEIETALDAALRVRDQDIADAQSEEERDAAIAAFEEARIAAYLESSAEIDVLARAFQAGSAAAEASARVRSESSTEFDAMWLQSESDASLFARMKVDSHDFPDEEAQGEARAAGDKLEADINAIAAGTADMKTELETAWSEYSATIRAQLTAQLEATTYVALQELQGSLNTAHETYAMAMANGESAATAQAALFASVTSETNVQALSATGMTEADAQAHLTVLAHLMLEGELPELPAIDGI